MTETMNEATYKLHSPQLLHSLPFQQQNKSVYIRSNTEEREENKQRGGEEWFSIPLTTKTLYNWCSFILNTGFNIWEERIMRQKTKTWLGLSFESIISAVQQKMDNEDNGRPHLLILLNLLPDLWINNRFCHGPERGERNVHVTLKMIHWFIMMIHYNQILNAQPTVICIKMSALTVLINAV